MLRRPVVISVFGALNIVLGSVSLFFVLPALVDLTIAPEMQALAGVLGQMDLILPAMVLQLVGAVLALASGVGLMEMQEWGRRLAVGFAIYQILVSTATGWLQVVTEPGPAWVIDYPSGVTPGDVASGLVSSFCSLVVYLGLQIYSVTRPEIRQAFRQTACGPAPSA